MQLVRLRNRALSQFGAHHERDADGRLWEVGGMSSTGVALAAPVTPLPLG